VGSRLDGSPCFPLLVISSAQPCLCKVSPARNLMTGSAFERFSSRTQMDRRLDTRFDGAARHGKIPSLGKQTTSGQK
jgi:hypothetical protein